jgi:hypothetical protein
MANHSRHLFAFNYHFSSLFTGAESVSQQMNLTKKILTKKMSAPHQMMNQLPLLMMKMKYCLIVK